MSKARTASRISGNCGTQILRRVRPVRLVVLVELVAERLLGLVEDHREMRRLVLRLHVAQQLPQHVAEAEHRVDLQPVGLAVQRRQRVVGAEDVAGAVDEEDVVALFHRARDGRRRWARRISRMLWPCGQYRPLATRFHPGGRAVHRFNLIERIELFGRLERVARLVLESRPGRPLEQETERRVAHARGTARPRPRCPMR